MEKSSGNKELDTFLNKIEEQPGFFKHNNYSFIEIKENCAILKAKLNENSMNPYNMAHGGLIFGLGDMAMGTAVGTTGRKAVTLNANINYLKPAIGKYLQAKAEIIKKGKTTCYLRCNIYNDQDVLVATMDSNYYYIS